MGFDSPGVCQIMTTLEQLLEEKFRSDTRRSFQSHRRCAFVWSETEGTALGYWGSYSYVFEDELKDRVYELVHHNDSVGIRYLDAIYDAEARRTVMKT